jgi:hypothetical protein
MSPRTKSSWAHADTTQSNTVQPCKAKWGLHKPSLVLHFISFFCVCLVFGFSLSLSTWFVLEKFLDLNVLLIMSNVHSRYLCLSVFISLSFYATTPIYNRLADKKLSRDPSLGYLADVRDESTQRRRVDPTPVSFPEIRSY